MVTPFTYFDTHTHKKYLDDDVAFIRNAFHHLTFQQLDKLEYPFSVGLHPWDVHRNFEISMAQLHATALHENCIAIGECGLDYSIKTDRKLQEEVFLHQKELAEALGKPVIIHCVRAYHDLISLIKTCRVPIILHQYIGNIETTKALLFDHVYFSFGKQLFRETFNISIFDFIPMGKVLFETDTMPIHIEEVYLKAASTLDVEFEELRNQVNFNAQSIFQK